MLVTMQVITTLMASVILATTVDATAAAGAAAPATAAAADDVDDCNGGDGEEVDVADDDDVVVVDDDAVDGSRTPPTWDSWFGACAGWLRLLRNRSRRRLGEGRRLGEAGLKSRFRVLSAWKEKDS